MRNRSVRQPLQIEPDVLLDVAQPDSCQLWELLLLLLPSLSMAAGFVPQTCIRAVKLPHPAACDLAHWLRLATVGDAPHVDAFQTRAQEFVNVLQFRFALRELLEVHRKVSRHHLGAVADDRDTFFGNVEALWPQYDPMLISQRVVYGTRKARN